MQAHTGTLNTHTHAHTHTKHTCTHTAHTYTHQHLPLSVHFIPFNPEGTRTPESLPLLYGPLKPVGLPDPRTGREPYAVVQLRQENTDKTMYNLVGFQTHLTWDEQRRVFGMIPGLEHAEFLRYGVMHRNTFMNSPKLLSADYSMRSRPNLFFAGQMTGVEGYIESTGSGYIAGVNAARRVLGLDPLYFPRETVLGAMASYISDERVTDFQPMNANFGLMPQLGYKVKGGKKGRNDEFARRALESAEKLVKDGILPAVTPICRAIPTNESDSQNGETEA